MPALHEVASAAIAHQLQESDLCAYYNNLLKWLQKCAKNGHHVMANHHRSTTRVRLSPTHVTSKPNPELPTHQELTNLGLIMTNLSRVCLPGADYWVTLVTARSAESEQQGYRESQLMVTRINQIFEHKWSTCVQTRRPRVLDFQLTWKATGKIDRPV